MIYDCFMYAGEEECLEIRLEELKGVVDKHVAVKAQHTFAGEWSEVRFPGILTEKVEWVIVEELLPLDPWKAEAYVRNQIMRGLTRCEPDDIIIISDADEIPRGKAVTDYWTKPHKDDDEIVALANTSYYYTLDWKVPWDHYYFPVIMRNEVLQDHTPQAARYHPDHHIDDAGWQFSCLGSAERLLTKLRSFAHAKQFESLTLNDIKAYMKIGIDIASRGNLIPVDIDESYPKCIQDNPERWKHLLRNRT